MDMSKPPGSAKYKTSISPSRALINEAERQVEAGQWESKTAFFEAGAWLLIEMQSLGSDLIMADTDQTAQPVDAREIARSAARLELNIYADQTPHPNDDDTTKRD